MAAKRPTGAYPKASKKDNAKRVFEAGVKSGKVKSVEAGMTGAMVAKVAGKVISKIAQKKAYKQQVTTPAKRVVKAAKAEIKADARGLKAANKPSLAPKNYKPDTAGRAEVKRYAAPLKDFNGSKRANKLAAGAVDAGRSAMKIKKAPVNKGK